MSGAQHGARNHQWKGGRSIASNGYVLVMVGKEHPLADVRGYAYEHRLVASEKIGRTLRDDEHVHHVDGNKTNNDPSNLMVVSREEHGVEHRHAGHALRMPGEANPVVSCECGCGETFERYDATNRPRRFVSGHNPQPATRRDAVLRVLERGPMHRAAIVEALDGQERAVATALSKLKLCGAVANDARGVWRKVSNNG